MQERADEHSVQLKLDPRPEDSPREQRQEAEIQQNPTTEGKDNQLDSLPFTG